MDEEIKLDNAILFLDSNRGIYIPQAFMEMIDEKYLSNVSEEDKVILLQGPKNEFYWDTWVTVLDNAIINDPEKGECVLHQDGDLWIVPKIDYEMDLSI